MKHFILGLAMFMWTCLGANAQIAYKTITPSTTFTGITTKGGSYAKQTKDFFVGWDKGNIGRGFLEFDLSSIPKDATITGADIYLNSKVAWDSNFGGKIQLYRANYINDANETTWGFLRPIGTPVIDLSKENYFTGEGLIRGYHSDILTAFVKELVGKKFYLSINNVDEYSKIMRISTEKDKLHLIVYYSGGTTTPPPSGGNSGSFNAPTIDIPALHVGAHSMTISWKDVDADEYIISLEKKGTGTGRYTSEKQKNAKPITFNNLESDTYYNIHVRATWRSNVQEADGGYSGYVREASVSDILTKPEIPESPKNVKAEFIDQSWENHKGLYISFDRTYTSNWSRDFCIYEYNYPWDGTIIRKIGLNYPSASRHLITNLEPNKTYLFGVTAKNVSGESTPSLVTITTPDPPGIPEPKNLTARSFGVNTYVLIWNYTAEEQKNITGFFVKRQTGPLAAGGQTEFTLSPETRSLYLGELPCFSSTVSTYIYSVYAINGSSRSKDATTGFVTVPTTKSSSIIDNDDPTADISASVYVKDDKIIIDGISKYTLNIYNLSGQLLMTKPNIDHNEIDISSFNKGVYIVHIITEGNTIVKKIIK